MAAVDKETLYVDVDDEITNVIDKLKASQHKIVALVLPKRATVFQSVVNMKLLKKAAQSAKKNVVLITSETALLPLAGAAGLHVAKSLQSKPAIPPAPREHDADEEETVSEEDHIDKHAAIGTLAAAASAKADNDGTETIELDNLTVDDVVAVPKETKLKKLKHLKVPNFERFRLGFFLAGLGVLLLILGWYFAFVSLPKAEIIVQTNTTSTVSAFDFAAGTDVTELNIDDREVPATLKELEKSGEKKVPATGEKDMGTKASGNVTLRLTDCSVDEVTVAEGTVVTADGLNYVTQAVVTMQSVEIGGNCQNDAFPNASSEPVDVVSADNGDKYNIGSGRTFAVSGYNNVTGSNDAGFGGGTSKIVKVVSQQDIDDAVDEMTEEFEQTINDELKAQFDAEQLFTLEATRQASKPKVTASPKKDQEAKGDVTVSMELTYSMLGVKRDDLQQLITKDVESDAALQGQALSDFGLDQASFVVNTQKDKSKASLSFRSTVVAGPTLDTNAIREAVRGKKRGEIEQYVGNLPGVDDVVVEYSPFWVYSTPKAAKKITVTIKNANDQQAAQNNESE